MTDNKHPVCSTCGSTTFTEKQVGPHLGLYCNYCEKWHSWIVHEVEHNPNFILTFGQHKGTKISLLPTAYLLYGEKSFRGALQKRFSLALEDRSKRFHDSAEQLLLDHLDPDDPRIPVQEFIKIFMAAYPRSEATNIPYWLNRAILNGARWKSICENGTNFIAQSDGCY